MKRESGVCEYLGCYLLFMNCIIRGMYYEEVSILQWIGIFKSYYCFIILLVQRKGLITNRNLT
ncbi:hypothetical protein V1523DRAFT_411250 [Lipomyces doorenjongii]